MRWNKAIGWGFLIMALGLFCIQLGYFFVQKRFQAEYVDNRLFYVITIICILCLLSAILLMLNSTRKFKFIGIGVAIVFITMQIIPLTTSNEKIKNVTSISPDFSHVLSIKKDMKTSDAVYYRSYFGILARPKERLPSKVASEIKVKWLANDIAVVTYQTPKENLKQYVATYGTRGNTSSYYYVGAQIHGTWIAESTKVIANTDGITVMVNGKSKLFDWNHIHQFGTLAIVLTSDQEAKWTITLDENIVLHANSPESITGNIYLYQATMKDNQPKMLRYVENKQK